MSVAAGVEAVLRVGDAGAAKGADTGARRYERGEARRVYRNGYYAWGLLSGFWSDSEPFGAQAAAGCSATNVF